MEAVLPSMLAMAMAADRLTRGRGNELATQAIIIWYAETAPMGILSGRNDISHGNTVYAFSKHITYKNMAKNRAPRLVVAVQIMAPATLTNINKIMWILRSLVFPDVHVTTRETRKVAIHTGAVMSRVSILP